MIELVEDRHIVATVTAAVGGTFIPDATRWTVVVDRHGQPATAIGPGGTFVPTNLVATGSTVPVAVVTELEGLARQPSKTAVVVKNGPAIIGVWAGDDLIDALAQGASRSVGGALPGDIQLPGRIINKHITRRCRYAQNGHECATFLVVPEKPDPMPPCSAQSGISAHRFVW